MASEVEICNIALSNIRAGSINSLSEGSLQAQICKLKYGILRNRCLREIPWTFNRKIKALTEVTTQIFNWAYAYQYPVDCLKIHRMIGSHGELHMQIQYEVFNFKDKKTISANQSKLRIDYGAKITDPNLFSDDFIMALSHLLSSEIAIPIVGAELGRALRNDSLQLYRQYLASAISADQNEQYFKPPESDFVTVRR